MQANVIHSKKIIRMKLMMMMFELEQIDRYRTNDNVYLSFKWKKIVFLFFLLEAITLQEKKEVLTTGSIDG